MRALLAALLLCAFGVAAGGATVQVPPDVREACTDDAMHFCPMRALLAAATGDLRGVRVCLARHRRDLSPACGRVLRRHGY